MKRKVKWEYCECGCKGSDATVNGVHFWHYWDISVIFDGEELTMQEGSRFLRTGGQGIFGQFLGEFKSLADLNKFVLKYAGENGAGA